MINKLNLFVIVIFTLLSCNDDPPTFFKIALVDFYAPTLDSLENKKIVDLFSKNIEIIGTKITGYEKRSVGRFNSSHVREARTADDTIKFKINIENKKPVLHLLSNIAPYQSIRIRNKALGLGSIFYFKSSSQSNLNIPKQKNPFYLHTCMQALESYDVNDDKYPIIPNMSMIALFQIQTNVPFGVRHNIVERSCYVCCNDLQDNNININDANEFISQNPKIAEKFKYNSIKNIYFGSDYDEMDGYESYYLKPTPHIILKDCKYIIIKKHKDKFDCTLGIKGEHDDIKMVDNYLTIKNRYYEYVVKNDKIINTIFDSLNHYYPHKDPKEDDFRKLIAKELNYPQAPKWVTERMNHFEEMKEKDWAELKNILKNENLNAKKSSK